MRGIAAMVALAGIAAAGVGAEQRAFIDDAIVREADAGGVPQVTTAELRSMLAQGEAVVLDARPVEEYEVAHIPGAVNVSQKPGTSMSLYISDVAEVMRLVPNRTRPLVVYCNGPFCGKSRRFAEELVAAGYTNVRRYQLGMPGWRTAGNVSAIEPAAIHRVAKLDATAVFVDAGLRDRARPVPGMVTLRAEDVGRAKDDGRLPMHDHNTRIVVLGATAAQARAVAEAIAANAFHNVAYFHGDGSELRGGGAGSSSAADDPLAAREAALTVGDAEAVLGLFADDAIVVTSSGRLLVGKAQFEGWVRDQAQRRQREQAEARQLQGNKVTWAGRVWRDDWERLGVSPLEVKQEAIVEGRRIRFFSTTLTAAAFDRLETARTKRPE